MVLCVLGGFLLIEKDFGRPASKSFICWADLDPEVARRAADSGQ